MRKKESNGLNSETSIKKIISDNPLHMIINLWELFSDEKNPNQKKKDKKKGKQEKNRKKNKEWPGREKIIAFNKIKKNEKEENKEEFKKDKDKGKNKLENKEKDKGKIKLKLKMKINWKIRV